MPAMYVIHAHRSAPEQEAQAAENQEKQEQRDQATQQAETKAKTHEWMPIIHKRHLGGRNRLDLNLLRQPLSHANIVGIYTDTKDGSDQHNYNQNSPKNSHFFSFLEYFEVFLNNLKGVY
jgi:hypothetical protein